MFNFVPKLATGEQKIENIKRITQDNIDISALVVAADAAAGQIARTVDPTLRLKFNELPKHIQSKASSMIKGVRDIGDGLPFTVNVRRNPYESGLVITSFAIESSTRPGVIYTPTQYGCQCEGFEHHNNCKHHMLYSVFEVYVGLINAEQDLVAAYAKLGIELVPTEKLVRVAPPTLNEGLEQMLDEFLAQAGIDPADLSKLSGH
jgi:hypothetical protein